MYTVGVERVQSLLLFNEQQMHPCGAEAHCSLQTIVLNSTADELQ